VGEERITEFENTLKAIKWDIVGVSEVRRKGESLTRRRNGNYFGQTKGYRGIGFYVKKEIYDNVYEIKSVNE